MSKKLRGLGRMAGALPVVLIFIGCGGGEDSPAADAASQGQADASIADARTTDARPAQLGCLTNPPPAGDPVTVGGFTKNILDNDAVTDVTIQAFKTSDNAMVVDTTSGTDGAFQLQIPTGGNPWNGYIIASAQDSADTYVYMPPLREDFPEVDLPVPS